MAKDVSILIEIRYLIEEVILSQTSGAASEEFIIREEGDFFSLQFKNSIYKEEKFDFAAPALDKSDFEFLESLISEADACSGFHDLYNLVDQCKITPLHIFKITHYFINEHYLQRPLKRDKHGRVAAASIDPAVKKFLGYPVVDMINDLLLKQLNCEVRKHRTLYLTSDFDVMSFKSGFSFTGFLKRQLKHFSALQVATIVRECWYYLFSEKRIAANPLLTDEMFYPDVYEEEIKMPEHLSIKRIAFFLVNKSHSTFDFKNHFQAKAIQEFIQKLKKLSVIFGIHPSYHTSGNKEWIAQELSIFEREFKERTSYCRFHFLKGDFPNDLTALSELGITHDFSFYFVEENCFRGGISKPFRMWNYEKKEPFEVIMTPITLMEDTLNQYLRLNYKDAFNTARKKINYSLFLGRSTVLLWHNTYFYQQYYKNNYQRKLFYRLKYVILQLIMRLELTERKSSAMLSALQPEK